MKLMKWLSLSGGALALLLVALPLSANDPESALSVEDQTVLALARVAWSERDRRRTRDLAAIAQRHHAVARRTGKPLLLVIQEGSPLATGFCLTAAGERYRRCRMWPERERQHWVATMRLDGVEPSGWPVLNANRAERGLLPLPWAGRNQERWLETVAEARRYVARAPRVCNLDPDTWGGACDENNEAASLTGVCDEAPAHWIRVDCGPICDEEETEECTLNQFYKFPRTRREREVAGTLPANVARGDRD
jgi:hypothetical protein